MAEAMKYQISSDLVDRLAARVAQVDGKAETATLTACVDQLDALELKDRINLVADALAGALSGSTKAKLKTVAKLSREEFGDFEAWPLCSFIERHTLDEPEASLTAMAIVTEAFSCEFAIRPYLQHHLELTLDHVTEWTKAPSEHVRRLASEGTRPRLPWGPNVKALSNDPTTGLGILERLRHDPSEYVRRSVANHLNDFAKTHPDLVVATTKRWASETDTNMAMIRHALRTLVKNGDPGALEVLGFTTNPEVHVDSFTVSPGAIDLGTSIELSATITSTAATDQHLVIDFVVHHINANGETSPKVFKWTNLELAAGATANLRKARKIATASTRRYHAGHHRVWLQIAGSVAAESGFDLRNSS